MVFQWLPVASNNLKNVSKILKFCKNPEDWFLWYKKNFDKIIRSILDLNIFPTEA